METHTLWQDLKIELLKYGTLGYDLCVSEPQVFWAFWLTHGHPAILVSNANVDHAFSKLIPRDATVWITDCTITSAFLNSLEHVEKVTCESAFDHNVDGYVGHILIDTIILTDVVRYRNLPVCNVYKITSDYTFHPFDCQGKKLYVPGYVLPRGFFQQVLGNFTNFTELIVTAFWQFHKETSGLPPGLILGIYSTGVFNPIMLKDMYFERLSLHGWPTEIVEHESLDLRIGEIVEYTYRYKKFVESINMRFQKTKRAN